MGVVHVLMVALTSITYGWQSDGGDGVEYIVQLSPAELKEVERLGEITSAIDPAIAGHVSRIRIRIGTGPLPREIPAIREQDLAVPIPSLDQENRPLIADSSQATPRGNAAFRQRKTSMMKPDAGRGTAGTGFRLPPSLGSSANNAANGIRDNFGQAEQQRALNTAGDSHAVPNDNDRFAAPDTHQHPAPEFTGPQSPRPGFTAPQSTGQGFAGPQSTGQRFTAPQFAGPPFSDSGSNRRMATTMPGRPSTEPTKPRDQSWTDSSGRRPSGPTMDAVDAERANPTSPRNSFGANPASSAAGSTNRTPSGTFGQTPAGVTFPPRNRSTDSGMNLDRNDSQFKTADLGDHDREFMQPRSTQFDQQGQPKQSQELAYPNRRKTDGQRDADDRLIDRNHQRQATSERPTQISTVRANPDRGMRDQNRYEPNRFQDNRGYRYQQPNRVQQGNMTRMDRSHSDPFRVSQQPDRRSIESRDPASLRSLDREAPPQEGSQDRYDTKPRNQVAAQGVFNFLLLISVGSNIYLVFWLKNLRLRFRDLVAAKRATSTNAQPT